MYYNSSIPALTALYYFILHVPYDLHEQLMVCKCTAELLLCWSFACDTLPSIFTESQNNNNEFHSGTLI